MTYLAHRRKAFQPSGVPEMPGLVRWYDANDISTLWQNSGRTTAVTSNDDPVGAWDDKSGGGNHLTQATAGSRPTYKSSIQGGLPGVNFAADFLEGTSTIAETETGYTVYAAVKLSGYEDWSGIYADGIANSWGNGGIGLVFDNGIGEINYFVDDYSANRVLYGATPLSSGYGVICGAWDGTDMEGYLDGVSQDTDTYSATLSKEDSNTYLGGYNGGSTYDMDLLEFIACESGHDSTKVAEITSYLETKWGI